MDYNLIVIGGGPGGYAAAIKAAQLGQKVCIIEKNDFGGTCLNVGCIPTKVLLKSAEIFNSTKDAENFGILSVDTDDAHIDLEKLQQRKKQIVSTLVNGVQGLLKKNGVDIIKGTASFIDADTIAVGDKTISSDNIIIATGSTVKSLPVPVSSKMRMMTSTDVLNLVKAPKSIAIVGGGVIGVELAYFMVSIGVDVKIIEFMDRILPMVDAEITERVKNKLREMGITIHVNAKVTEIKDTSVQFEVAGDTKEEECDAVLVAVGRIPYIEGLDVEKAGIKVVNGAVVTDETMRTNIPNIYAIGDVNGKIMLAHTAYEEAMTAVQNICGDTALIDYDSIPSAIYIQPEVASIGLTEEQARAKYGEIKIGKFPLSANGKSLIEDERDGFIKIITEAKYLQIVGAHIYSAHATELIAEMSLAMKLECTADEIANVVHPHPTISEAVHEACMAAVDKAIHF